MNIKDEPHLACISKLLLKNFPQNIVQVFKNIDTFIWNHIEMVNLILRISVCKVSINYEITPVKSNVKRIHLGIEKFIIYEVSKLIDVNFNREEVYPACLTNYFCMSLN